MAYHGSEGNDLPKSYSVWLSGGGIRPSASVGRTDDLGFAIAADPVSVHDLHATLLHQFGFDHTKLTYRFQGRDFRLTDVAGKGVAPLIS